MQVISFTPNTLSWSCTHRDHDDERPNLVALQLGQVSSGIRLADVMPGFRKAMGDSPIEIELRVEEINSNFNRKIDVPRSLVEDVELLTRQINDGSLSALVEQSTAVDVTVERSRPEPVAVTEGDARPDHASHRVARAPQRREAIPDLASGSGHDEDHRQSAEPSSAPSVLGQIGDAGGGADPISVDWQHVVDAAAADDHHSTDVGLRGLDTGL